MGLKAVLFDMDGVIVDTEPLHRKSYYKTFEELNIEVTPEYYATFTGKATKKVCQGLVEKFHLSSSYQEVMARKRELFDEFFKNDSEFDLLPGARELFENCQENGIQMVLASSASVHNIELVFDKFGIRKYFKGVVSGDELEESKPNPEIFNIAQQLSGEDKKDCMVIEDSYNGILAASRANIFCAAYKSKNSKMQDYSLANIVVSHLIDLKLDKISRLFKD